MRCPYCKHDKGKVIDSRGSGDGSVIRRRRECLHDDCRRRFTTYERIEETPLRVVKKDGTRAPFDRQKILSGLLKACEKRPISVPALEDITDRIERFIHENWDREVSSDLIGEQVMESLKNLDKVAYVRFASVYREFQAPEDFLEELKKMPQ
jgi:transcriptional repressor NrdR